MVLVLVKLEPVLVSVLVLGSPMLGRGRRSGRSAAVVLVVVLMVALVVVVVSALSDKGTSSSDPWRKHVEQLTLG